MAVGVYRHRFIQPGRRKYIRAFVPTITGTVFLSLPQRDLALSLQERSVDLTLPPRDIALKPYDRG